MKILTKIVWEMKLLRTAFLLTKNRAFFLNLTQLLKSFQGRKLNSVFYSEFPSKFLCS